MIRIELGIMGLHERALKAEANFFLGKGFSASYRCSSEALPSESISSL